jgi:hypothetical protein
MCVFVLLKHVTREVLLKGRLSTVDLLVLTSLDQLLFILKILFAFLETLATLMRRSTVLNHPLQLVFPDVTLTAILRHFQKRIPRVILHAVK